MFVIQREERGGDRSETLLKDGTWTAEDRGSFDAYPCWVDALNKLLRLERDHKTYHYHTYEIAVVVQPKAGVNA